MPVVFYLDFVAMHISLKIMGRVCTWETNLIHLEKHISHCGRGKDFGSTGTRVEMHQL